jgi:hypothetical protein
MFMICVFNYIVNECKFVMNSLVKEAYHYLILFENEN